MSRSSTAGRHEHGQNFLVDARVIATLVDAVAATRGPVLELGAGDGALTRPLSRLGRPVTAIEIDARRARALERSLPGVAVVVGDMLRAPLPRGPHVVVGNLPFHVTTAVLRRVLAAPAWTDAVLLVQWEVARRRAGVGGATLMTAQAWPWFEFRLLRRVPARAFRPVPAVDGGILVAHRREAPLVPERDRRRYAAFVARVFTGPGRGLREILRRAGVAPGVADAWLRSSGLPGTALPRHPTAEQWAALWRAHRGGPPGGLARGPRNCNS